MTETELLTNELTHRYSGNGYAVVEILPPSISSLTGKPTQYVRVTDKWCKFGQAFLAAVDHLEITSRSAGIDPAGKPYDPNPVPLTAEDFENLRPLREGIKDGSIKVVATRFVATKTLV